MKNSKTNPVQPIYYNQFDEVNVKDISSAKYSDISSHWMHDVKNNSQIQLHNLSLTPIQKRKKIKDEQIDEDLSSNSQLTKYFYEEDSLLSLNQIFPQQQFRHMAKQLEIDPITRESIAYKFYSKENNKNINAEKYDKYYVQYLQWKEIKSVDSNLQVPEAFSLKTEQNRKNKNNKNSEISNLVNKQLQYEKYKSEQLKRNQQTSQKQMKLTLKKLSDEYKNKLKANLQQISYKKQINNRTDVYSQKLSEKQQKILSVQKIEYPLLNSIQTQNYQILLKKQQQRKLTELNQKSFVNIIKNPPRSIKNEQNIQIPIQQKAKITTNNNKQQKVKKVEWKLDVDQILKIPYRQFLLFYEQFQNKIIALTSPQQLKRIRKYRKEALDRQQALNKLKNKINTSGQQILNKLSLQKKKQLFQLLYEDQVREQKQKLNGV